MRLQAAYDSSSRGKEKMTKWLQEIDYLAKGLIARSVVQIDHPLLLATEFTRCHCRENHEPSFEERQVGLERVHPGVVRRSFGQIGFYC
jgi:hypothetical protein